MLIDVTRRHWHKPSNHQLGDVCLACVASSLGVVGYGREGKRVPYPPVPRELAMQAMFALCTVRVHIYHRILITASLGNIEIHVN